MIAVLFLVVVIVAYQAGWVRAHWVVATECEKLGRFYVGDRVFYCERIERRSQGADDATPSDEDDAESVDVEQQGQSDD